MMWKLREAAARALRRLADRLYEDDTYRCFSGYFNVVQGVGCVITKTEGVEVSPEPPGTPLYFREDEYERAFQAPPPPPVGTVVAWPTGKPAPEGWFLLDGSYYGWEHKELNAILGSPHLPDMRPGRGDDPRFQAIIYAGKP